jgi:spoIIIJ-associated protein
MQYFEGEGKTAEDALQRICDQHGISKDKLEYEILEHKKRILGLFGEDTIFIKAWRKTQANRKPVEIVEKLCSLAGLVCKISLRKPDDDTSIINITGPDLGMVIGKNGEVLDALQFLTRKIVNRGESEPQKIVLDADGYRERKVANLKRLALRSAKQVKETGQSLVLEPMNAHDRRIVHLELQEDRDVFTKSLGEGSLKKIMIAHKKTQRDSLGTRDRI